MVMRVLDLATPQSDVTGCCQILAKQLCPEKLNISSISLLKRYGTNLVINN